MDTFSHALWGYGLFGFRKYPKFAALMGAMPDLISFGALLLLRVIEGNYSVGKPALATLVSRKSGIPLFTTTPRFIPMDRT